MAGTLLFPLEQGEDEKKYDRTDDRDDELPCVTACVSCEKAHDPSAEETADDTDDDVDKQSKTAASHQFASHPAGSRTDEQINDNSQSVAHNFLFWLNNAAKIKKMSNGQPSFGIFPIVHLFEFCVHLRPNRGNDYGFVSHTDN